MNKWAFTLVFDVDFSQYDIKQETLTGFIIKYINELLGDFGSIKEQFSEPNRLTVDIVIIADSPDEAEDYLYINLRDYNRPPNNMKIIRINDYE